NEREVRIMTPLIELKAITKSFPGVKALDKIDLDLMPGEVHVLIGENGAGKSTLMKVISGAYQADSGELFVDGKKILKNSPIISEQLGIGMIYQELNLIPELSVAQNIFLGNPIRRGFLNQNRRMNQRSQEIMKEQLNVVIDSKQLVKELGVGMQQMIEIVKTLARDAKILVFDEPTSSLADFEIKQLFCVIRALKEKGIGMFYISHRLEEIFEIGDRVTIMRDGQKISTNAVKDMTMDYLIEGIAGRKIDNLYPHTRKEQGKPMLEIKNLTGKDFENVSVTVHAGEIVGMSGLVGAGRTEMARAAFGVDHYTAGEVWIDGEKLPPYKPALSVQKGFCLLPENRKTEGLALPRSVSENIVIAALNQTYSVKIGTIGIVNAKKEAELVKQYIKSLKIATPTLEKKAQFLSGGTQQKVVLAKWLLSQCKVFVFDEPTRGIDVGAKSEIYSLMDELVDNGAAILMISSDLPEMLGMADRVYVMCHGRISGELDTTQATQNKILKLAFGQQESEEKADA
ncbi:MAG: sugar ABC transporter ATP-binding protein, partial [Ruthenibacterium sp.]